MFHKYIITGVYLFIFQFLISCNNPDSPEQILSSEAIEEINQKDIIYLEKMLPVGFKADGSVSYIKQIQSVLDNIENKNKTLVFPEITVLIDNPNGITVKSNTKIIFTGTQFLVSKNLKSDGQILFGKDVNNVEITGGTFTGNRKFLPVSVNIAGIYLTGNVNNITIKDCEFRDLSSNGIRVIGSSIQNPAKNIIIMNIKVDNSCNEYIDYLLPNKGPAIGTDREDQGNIALYYVSNFLIDKCLLSNSRSDGTHFYYCSYGVFSNNSILKNRMGGYFVETCTDIEAFNNQIIGNGSRGVTIERGSKRCNLKNSTISESGREGIWLDDSENIQVYGNQISFNGRKKDKPVNNSIRITDSSWPDKKNESKSRYISIINNIIESDSNNDYAVWAHSCSRDINVRYNVVSGAGRAIVSDSWHSGYGNMMETDNKGWVTNKTVTDSIYITPGKLKYELLHNLDCFGPDKPDVILFQFVKLLHWVKFANPSLGANVQTSADKYTIKILFNTQPANYQNKWVKFTYNVKYKYL